MWRKVLPWLDYVLYACGYALHSVVLTTCVLVPPHTYPNGSSSPETAPEHSASLHRNYGYASDLSKHSGTISGKLSSRRFRRGEVLVKL